MTIMVEGHRYLERGDHVHVDVSRDFSEAAKWSVAGLFYTIMILLFRTSKNRHRQASISLAGAVVMVIGRSLLHLFGQGPLFVIHRSAVVEPLLVCFGNLFIVGCFLRATKNTADIPFYNMIIKFSSISQYANSIVVMTTSAAITAVLGDYSAALLLSPACLTDSSKLALLSGMTVGATLTTTGSLSNILAMSVAYDETLYAVFVADKLWPSVATFVIYGVALKCCASKDLQHQEGPKHTTNNTLYIGVAKNDSHKDNEHVSTVFSEVDDEEKVIANDADKAVSEMDVSDSGVRRRGQECAFIATIVLHLMIMGVVRKIYNEQLPGFFVVADIFGALLCAFFFGFGTVQICMLVMSFLLTFAVDMVTVSLTAASCWLLYFSWTSRMNAAVQQPSPLYQVDFSLLINLAGQLVVTSSMADTGLFQKLIYFSLGGCTDEATSFPCVFRFAVVVAALSMVTSTFHVNIILAATFPYFTPYDWMQVTLVTSLIRNLTWTGFDRPLLEDQLKYAKFMVPTAIVSIAIGIQLLSMFHVSFECSKRLGECV